MQKFTTKGANTWGVHKGCAKMSEGAQNLFQRIGGCARTLRTPLSSAPVHMSPVGRSVCHNFLKGREEYISMLKKIGGKDG